MELLHPARRRALRAKAHHLDPVVTIGHHGLTPAVLHEIDVALRAHELVKVRVIGDDREGRDALLASICTGLDCAPVQQIGKLFVLWRQREEKDVSPVPTAAKPPPSRQVIAKRSRPPATKRAPRGVPRAALPRRRRGV
ncbi:MAG TPA: YhbY family RNA-binding protein [Casimicrobiaceae bacterium]|nr:YhbY family RNA-binding protein [Casimicrobiaceae bacterium]